MSIALATAADVNEMAALLATVEDELLADFGTVSWTRTNNGRRAYFNTRLAGQWRALVYRDAGGVLQAFISAYKADGEAPWIIELTAADKTLAANIRVARFVELVRDLAARVPAATAFGGWTKEGGRVDTYLVTRVPGRVVSAGLVRYLTTAGELLAVLV